jgi:N-methylhydantoinase B/oxoprolinase/acetone carboxylase alpha subunit
MDRDPEKVRWDVMNEYISNKTARNIYGVVIDAESFAIDYKATEIKRQKLRAKRSDKG